MFCLLLLPLPPSGSCLSPPPFFRSPPAASATDQPDRLTCLPKLLRCVSVGSTAVRVPHLRSSFALWSGFICLASCEVLPWPLGQLDKIRFGRGDSCFRVSVCVMLNIMPDWSARRSTSDTSHNLLPYGSLIDWDTDPKRPTSLLFKEASPPQTPLMEWSHQSVRAVS